MNNHIKILLLFFNLILVRGSAANDELCVASSADNSSTHSLDDHCAIRAFNKLWELEVKAKEIIGLHAVGPEVLSPAASLIVAVTQLSGRAHNITLKRIDVLSGQILTHTSTTVDVSPWFLSMATGRLDRLGSAFAFVEQSFGTSLICLSMSNSKRWTFDSLQFAGVKERLAFVNNNQMSGILVGYLGENKVDLINCNGFVEKEFLLHEKAKSLDFYSDSKQVRIVSVYDDKGVCILNPLDMKTTLSLTQKGYSYIDVSVENVGDGCYGILTYSIVDKRRVLTAFSDSGKKLWEKNVAWVPRHSANKFVYAVDVDKDGAKEWVVQTSDSIIQIIGQDGEVRAELDLTSVEKAYRIATIHPGYSGLIWVALQTADGLIITVKTESGILAFAYR